MAKEIFYGEDARRKLQSGVDQLANTVKITPVSYTHLDVYKRQRQCCKSKTSGTLRRLPRRADDYQGRS